MGIKSTVKNNYLSGENTNYVISNTVAVTVQKSSSVINNL